jgi:hypothetical protein
VRTGYLDLGLKFDAQALAAALGAVGDGQLMVLQLTATLKVEFGGGAIRGEDVITILKKSN